MPIKVHRNTPVPLFLFLHYLHVFHCFLTPNRPFPLPDAPLPSFFDPLFPFTVFFARMSILKGGIARISLYSVKQIENNMFLSTFFIKRFALYCKTDYLCIRF